jgi:SAM-dependent methyltransferase
MQSSHTNAVHAEGSRDISAVFGQGQCLEKVQGHWVLARAGKRVLRPGGIELTQGMLDALAIGPQDHVVEFAPGLGITARITLQRQPASYCGVEREPAAIECLWKSLAGTSTRIVFAEVGESGLPDSSATVVYGEALLSMQRPEEKNRIIAEARRLLVPGGRFGIHELCFMPDDIPDAIRREIQLAMSKAVHGGIQPLTRREWTRCFEQNRLKVIWSRQAPMHLLEPRRLLRDEGFGGALRFVFNVATNPMVRRRIFAMRQLFRRYAEHLDAISLVGELQRGIA